MNILAKLARLVVGEPDNSPVEESKQTKQDRPPEKARQNKSEKSGARKKTDTRERSGKQDGTKKHRKRSNDRRPNKKTAQQRQPKAQDRQEQTSGQQPSSPPKQKVEAVGFQGMGLREEILQAVGEQGYSQPTPIQQASIADLVKGRDLLGCAQTGTGKTASFALPTLQILSQNNPKPRRIRVLVLTPTRELALQVKESYTDYGRHLPLKSAVIFGGVGAEPQKKQLRAGVDILVATPGRLLDLHQQRCVNFNALEILVLDEADRMLDMGFLPDVKRIVKLLPKIRQNILFSATMPKDIADLSMNILNNPVKVEAARVSSASEQVEQRVYQVNRSNKSKLLLHVLEDPATYKVLVFTRTKSIANRITSHLLKHKISAEAIHGNKSQSARQRALENFKGEKTRVLVASDLAARGIDVEDITHVINYDVPNVSETYVHRIGRTGRASAVGTALSFVDSEERAFIRDIERLIGKNIPVVEEHPFPFKEGEVIPARERVSGQNQNRRRGRPGQNRGRPSNSSNRNSGGGSSRGGSNRGHSNRGKSNRGGRGNS